MVCVEYTHKLCFPMVAIGLKSKRYGAFLTTKAIPDIKNIKLR
jgi:hypothetical protein